jgi:hypothetical protein
MDLPILISTVRTLVAVGKQGTTPLRNSKQSSLERAELLVNLYCSPEKEFNIYI